MRAAKLLLPSMIARGEGQLTLVSSVLGRIGSARRSGYAASKHALHGFFDSLRIELASTGIGISMPCPGPVDTGIGERAPDGGSEAPPPHQVSARDCALSILDSTAARERERPIGRLAFMGMALKRVSPGLLDRLLVRRAVP